MKKKLVLFWDAPLWRAALEAALCAVVLLVFGLIPRDIPEFIAKQWLVIVSGLTGSLLGLRLEPGKGNRLRKVIRDLGVAILAGVVLAPISLGIAAAFGQPDYISQKNLGLAFCVFYLLLVGAAFLFWRVFRSAWIRWQHLRRTHFQWNLIHASLSIIAAFMFLMLIGTIFFTLFQSYPDSLSTGELSPLIQLISHFTRTIFPQILLFTFFLAASIAVAAPPLIFFSYLISRRLTQRLKSLTETTQRLRKGDLSARAEVSGEDEVAQLQTNFNAMAAELEQKTAQLQTERDRVTELLKAQRELTAAVSHELRTPVATLLGYLEHNLERAGSDAPGSLHKDLEIMHNETQRLQTLIEDLFTLSRSAVDKLSMECGPVDIANLAQHTLDTIRPLTWQNNRVELVAELPQGLPPVWADPVRLEQILRNLLQNAIHHTPPGGIVVVRAESVESFLRLSVIDTGEGIAPEHLPHIWERFYRCQGDSHPGAGLGLALVRELAQAMGGCVGVASSPGESSHFWVDLKPAP